MEVNISSIFTLNSNDIRNYSFWQAYNPYWISFRNMTIAPYTQDVGLLVFLSYVMFLHGIFILLV